MRQILWQYLGTFKQMYPNNPSGTWEVYERALFDIDDVDLSAACEICLRECSYFPMPAEIRKRVTPKDTFISTAPKYEDNPPGIQEKEDFEREMDKVAAKLGIRRIAKSL